MEAKINFLLDRSTPFTPEKVQILDQLSVSIRSNASDVYQLINAVEISELNMETT